MIRVLFVCMGNICRSPAAESIFRHLVESERLEGEIFIDSAGTIGYHKGECTDPRMITYAEKRGYKMTHLARQFNPDKDFVEFDFIVTMDDDNYHEIQRWDREGRFSSKLFKMTQFGSLGALEIPDPYYGGAKGFEHVLDLLEDACARLFIKVKEQFERSS